MKKLLPTLALWLVYVPMAHAQDLGVPPSGFGGYSEPKPLPTIIGNLIRTFTALLGIIFLVMILYAGFLYLTARGEEEKVKHAKETIQRGVIGLIIIAAAYAIASFVINALTISVKGSATP